MKTKKSECLVAENLDWPDNTDNIALNALTVNNDEENHGDDNQLPNPNTWQLRQLW